MKSSSTTSVLVVMLSLLSGWGQRLPAQQPAERSFLDSLLARVDRANSPTQLPPTSECTSRSATLGRLCAGVVALRRAEFTLAVPAIDNVRTQLERVVEEQPSWATGWYALGRVRLLAEKVGMVAREGPLQQAGTTNFVGAGAALDQAVELDPQHSRALLLLASAPVPWHDTKRLADRVVILRRGRALLPPEALVGVALFELDAGSVDSAIAFLKVALASQSPMVPRGLAQISLARALYRVGQSAQGRAALFAGASETDSEGVAAYREQLSWVGDSTEMRIWNTLQPTRRPAWLAAFWSKRDVEEGRRDGERLIEHYRRVNLAFARYRIRLPAAGHQTMITSLGEPDYQLRLREEAAQHRGDTASLINEYALARVMVGAQSPFRSFKSRQSVLDDRGLVFIRHGPPDDSARKTVAEIQMTDNSGPPTQNGRLRSGNYDPSEMATYEIWRYNLPLPAPPLILSFRSVPFSGSVEPTVLVPTLLAEDPGTRAELCVVDASICPRGLSLVGDIVNRKHWLLDVTAARAEGNESIKQAVTTDRFVRPFSKAINGSFEIHVLDLAQGGAPRLVVAFALPGQDLVAGSTGPNGTATYPVHLQIMASRLSDGMRFDIDTLRQFSMMHTLSKNEFISALSELPLSAGRWNATVVISQTGKNGADDRGIKATIENLSVPDLSLNLAVSDMVLGREDVGLRWHSGPGGQQVALNPLNTFPKGSTAALYAQIAGLTPEEPYEATIELFEGGASKGLPKLTVKLSEVAHASRVELSRALGLGQLNPGRYLVRLTIKADGKSVVTTGGLEILK